VGNDPFRVTSQVLEVFLRVTPKASVNRVQGTVMDATGVSRIKVQVTALPEKGKANAVVVKLLSKLSGAPKTACSVISGKTDRNKTVLIAGDGNAYGSALSQKLAR